ncbi:hypothetical protein [Limimaricola cinnabarinus]|uniref:hypothetical protein n=1 Tax=Limimaricola cinnabarinus TaxID=1125964 RepID=UPI0013A5FDBF|nr:hypothetical protein [Limimaricola cinnabarinus]
MMIRTVGIVAVAGAAALIAASFVSDDMADVTQVDNEFSQLAEPPTADIGGNADSHTEPVEDIGEEAVPAIDQPTTEMLTNEVEEETLPPVPGREPTVLRGDDILARQVESEAEAILGTEAAGSNVGLAILEEAVSSETFDYDALLEEIGNSSLEENRKEELMTALGQTGGEREAVAELLEQRRSLDFDSGLWDRDGDGLITKVEFDLAWVEATEYTTSYDGDLSGGLDAPEELTGDFSAFDLNSDGVLAGPEIAHLAAMLEGEPAESTEAD